MKRSTLFSKQFFTIVAMIGLGALGVPAYMATPVANVIGETVEQHVQAAD